MRTNNIVVSLVSMVILLLGGVFFFMASGFGGSNLFILIAVLGALVLAGVFALLAAQSRGMSRKRKHHADPTAAYGLGDEEYDDVSWVGIGEEGEVIDLDQYEKPKRSDEL